VGTTRETGEENIAFEPADVTVAKGGTVTWTNDEAVAHDVERTRGPGKTFSSGPEGGMQQGDTYKVTLKQPGTYEYVCRVHAPNMAGTITVK
jgi:plastocyanin